MEKVIMIYANGCDECKSMRQAINSISKFLEVDDKIELFAYDCENDDAIDIALEYGISEVPGCSIGGIVIEGEDFDKDEILEALKKFSK